MTTIVAPDKTIVTVGGGGSLYINAASGGRTLVTAPTGLQGPPGHINVVELTQDAYDALVEKDPETIYVITDGTVLAATIISGLGPPDPTIGSDGDYYLDKTGHVLYGPKATAWPVALVGIPPGGTAGQTLRKLSSADFNVGWG